MKKFQNLWTCEYLLWKISFHLITYNESSGTLNYSFVKNVFFSTLTAIYVPSSSCISSVKWNWGLKTVELVWNKNIAQLLIFIELFKENIKTKSYTGLWKFRAIANTGKRIWYSKKKNGPVRHLMFMWPVERLLNRLSSLNRCKISPCWLTRKITQGWL